MTELTDADLEAVMQQMDGEESPSTIVVPQSIIDKYGVEAIEEFLNEA